MGMLTDFLIGPNSPSYDSGTQQLGNMSRNQWQMAYGAAMPLQNQLIQYAENPSAIGEAMQAAGADTNAAFSTAATDEQRLISQLGAPLSPEQQASAAKSQALSKGLATAGNENLAAQQTYANQQGVLQGAG